MFKGKMTEAILVLAREIRESREQRNREFEWFRSHIELATKTDLKELERRIMRALEGVISGADQKLLDALTARAEALAKKLYNLDSKTK